MPCYCSSAGASVERQFSEKRATGDLAVLTFELLDRGLTSAVGIDLSSAYVAVASDEAARRGRSGAVQFVHGDFVDVADRVARADVVTLDRVVCCYADCERLLDESLRHAEGPDSSSET